MYVKGFICSFFETVLHHRVSSKKKKQFVLAVPNYRAVKGRFLIFSMVDFGLTTCRELNIILVLDFYICPW